MVVIGENAILFDSQALTKIQSFILIAIIAISAVGAAYVLLPPGNQSSGTIKIGVCSDIGAFDDTWEGAILAAEQVNSEGGILGKKIKIIREDTDAMSMPLDPSQVSLAVTKLITVHKVNFVIGGFSVEDNMIIQDVVAQNKIIFIGSSSPGDVLTERVQNNYEKYKYFFKYDPPSESDLAPVARDTVVALREYTGFNKLAYIAADSQMWNGYIQNAIEPLAELDGFELVYGGRFPPDILDFSSYFAAAEAAGAEILFPVILGPNGIKFINEWYDRQSPMVIWGIIAAGTPKDVWEITDGKCEHVTVAMTPQNSGYPITTKTLPMLQDYLERWDKPPTSLAVSAYDIIRFVLPDALERAGTLETEPVIEALEEIDVETSSTGHFAISADSHEILFGPGYATQFYFQWQANGKFVPVYPRDFKEQEDVTYTFPDWPGPWDDLD